MKLFKSSFTSHKEQSLTDTYLNQSEKLCRALKISPGELKPQTK